MKKMLALVAVLLGAAVAAQASTVSYQKSLVNKVLTSSQTYDLDLSTNGIDAFSFQLVYSSASPSTVTFGDGVESTGNFTVSSLTNLTTSYASNKITVVSTNGLTGAYLTFNGHKIYNDGWRITYTSYTAIDVCAALNKDYSDLITSTVTVGQSVIYSTATATGTAANAYTLTSSTQAALSVNAATYSGGNDAATITIAGYKLNVVQYVGVSTGATATNLAAAINASPAAAAVKAAASGSVIYATATAVGAGTNYAIASSSPTAIVPSGSFLTGGADTDIWLGYLAGRESGLVGYSYLQPNPAKYTNGTIVKSPTSWGNGLPVLFNKTAGTVPGGLTDKTTYYVTALTSTSFKLTDTSTGAVAATPTTITITTTTAAGAGSFTLTPIAMTGFASMTFQDSNDGTNFETLSLSTGTVIPTYTASSTTGISSALWSITTPLFRWFRFKFVPAGWGGVNVNVVVNGKQN